MALLPYRGLNLRRATQHQAESLGRKLLAHLRALQTRHAQIGDVRGLGAMLAIELVRGPQSKEPAPELADRMVVAAREQGLISSCSRPDSTAM